jgi:N-acyl-D-amino-acid deacylase
VADLLIRGGSVIDGTGGPAQPADVRVRGGVIVEIGPRLSSRGERVIDATGAVVTPGFIDSHTHLDVSLFWDPLCDPLPQHGVTTALMGNCSLSLAPAHQADRQIVGDLFSYIEDIPYEAVSASVPWEWESFSDYARALRSRAFGINMLSLVGHSMLRLFVLGDAAWERAATPAEIARIAHELDQALVAGAIGLSCSFSDRDRHGRLVPSALAEDKEFKALFRVLKRRGGIFQFIPHSSRDLDRACADIERVGHLARESGVTALHNIVVHYPRNPDRSATLLACVNRLQAGGARIYSMVSPRPMELSINFDRSLCFIDFPVWNECVQTAPADKRAKLLDSDWRRRARIEFDSPIASVLFPKDRPQELRIVQVGHPEFAHWIGRSLQDLIDARGGHPSDVLAQWLLDNHLDTSFVYPVANTDAGAVARLLQDPATFVSASDAGAHMKMFCGVGDTTLLLTRHVRERGDLSLVSAIHELTCRQADLLGLAGHGRIGVGYAADFAVFALDELKFAEEKLVSDVPGGGARFRRDSGGYRYTIVNGVVVQEAGTPTGALPARFIRAAGG